MRTIKFRVWDGKRFQKQYNTDLIGWGLCDLVNEEMRQICDWETQQFTGLTDKNGVEIYEGDIVKDLDKENGTIKYEHGSFLVDIKKRLIPFWSMVVTVNMIRPRIIKPETFEIIGNIYENPELLNKIS